MLPFATAKGETTTFLDALFTAATSVCVTGLVTVTTATHWTLFGKGVILVLIQLGGLGIITVSTLMMMIMGRRIGLKSRKMIQESYNLDSFSGLVRIIRKVVLFTILVELLGVICYAVIFIPEYGFWPGVGHSLFTAVSSFCNAGMDTLGENSLAPYVLNPVINITTMVLIVAGGLGFYVWFDLGKNFREMLSRGRKNYSCWRNLALHSKLAIYVTVLLIAGGALIFLLLEYNNSKTIGSMSFGQKLMASAFQSVTTRTAGFLTIDQSSFTDASMVVTLFLMLIGGSPMGTAGGIKTTTLAILIMTVAAYLRGKSDTEVFHRKIKDGNIRTAIVVMCMGMLTLVLSLVALSINMDASLNDLMFEVTSALGTVGLSRGITAELTNVGKVIIIISMYLGRIGPITLATAITMRAQGVTKGVHLAEERVIIG